MAILGLIIAVAVIITLLVLNDSPGSGLGMLAIPLMPIVWIFYPVYFTILALRYSREKSNMDPLDKITFYLLLVHIGGFFIFALSTLAK